MSADTCLCPALFLAAPASGQGKTTITAALARFHKNQGRVVRVFKTGPDYLDPQILEQASGQPVEQLDLWMAGDSYCRAKLYEAALVADLILIEGAMGMFDGEPSSADLAATFGIPIAIVMDVKGMAQTAAALTMGLVNFRDDYEVAGLIANRCGSQRHADLIKDALPDSVPLLATLKRDENVILPERHLGLVQASEVYDELETRFEAGVEWLADSALTVLPKSISFTPESIADVDILLSGIKVAVARDAAFSFIYQSNIRLLEAMGATVKYFSPIKDTQIPEADVLWLPGGYPELHAQALADNTQMLKSIQQFYQQDKVILAECGGFLYCLDQLTDLDGVEYALAGILNGTSAMRGRSGCQGMQTAVLPEGEVRAHAHHRSRSDVQSEPVAHGKRQRHPAPGEAIYRDKNLTATYLHLFFPSNPQAIADLFLAKIGDNAILLKDVS